MEFFPHRAPLYRTLRQAVSIALAAVLLAGIVWAQFARKATPSKGPRAIGLLQLAANGKGHLVPIVIMWDGRFYDAGSYKADPVPMALESGTVYEVERTGVSQGLFTVSVARQLKDAWTADGTFQPPGVKTEEKKPAERSRPFDDDVDTPPTLKRPGAKKPEPAPSEAQPQSPKAAPPTTASASAAQPPSEPEPPADPDRPTLRRGAAPQVHSGEEPQAPTTIKPASSKNSAAGPANTSAIQIIPAISDANGPEPRPFTYDAKPDELQKFRKKMLALAATEVFARARQAGSLSTAPEAPKRTTPRRSVAAKAPQPVFDDVELRIFDLASSNEPVLVLTAKARMPQTAASAPSDYYLALVARDDIYGELHKAFASVTDNQHLDALPRLELIDAIDADGDGQGELLFRQISDAGTSYSIYRVIGNQLYALYQGPVT